MSFLIKIAKVAMVLLLIEVLAIILFAGVIYYGDQLPENNQAEVSAAMHDSVLHVTAAAQLGTCFAVVDGSGQIKLLTNRHVCDAANGLPMTVQKNLSDMRFSVTIDKMSIITDLCLLTPSADLLKDGLKPLKMGYNVYHNDPVHFAGYPLYNIMTISYGYTKSFRQKLIPYPLPTTMCNFGNFVEIDTRQLLPADMAAGLPPTICTFNIVLLGTTIPGDGGSSGSPLLNDAEEVVGVIESVDGKLAWAQAVPIEYVKKFIGVK